MEFLEKILPCPGRVEEMGFLRPITPAELNCEYWYRLGEMMVGWLEPTQFKNFWCPHFVVAKWARGHIFPIVQFAFDELKQEAFHASGDRPGLMFALPPDQRALGRIFMRLGFVYDAKTGLFYTPFGKDM